MALPLPKQLTTKEALLSTLVFFDVIGAPVSRADISKYFLFEEPNEARVDSYLRESPLVCSDGDYFSLNKDSLVNLQARLDLNQGAWTKIKRYKWIFDLCPFIEMVGVCNSLCLGSYDKESDIDLLVVVKPNRMFIARSFLTALTHLFRVRRHGAKVAGRFCLSFYVDQDHLDFSLLRKEPYDLYLAFWLKSLEPISGKYEIYESLMLQNEAWLAPYFSSFTRNNVHYSESGFFASILNRFLEFVLGRDSLERRLRNWQWDRMMEKFHQLEDKSGTIIRDFILKFHDKDKRDWIRREWVKRLDALL